MSANLSRPADGGAPAPAPAAVCEVLAWLEAVERWLAGDAGRLLPKWYDVPLGSANGPTVAHPAHAAATVRALAERVAVLEAALREVAHMAPEVDPGDEADYTTCEDAYTVGDNARHYACAEIARRALRAARRGGAK